MMAMSPTLCADVFGRLIPIAERVAPDPESPQVLREYLWSIFRDRSEHMMWSIDETVQETSLWNVEEAELTYHLHESRLGFAQVSLDVNPATADLTELITLDEPPPGLDLSQGKWSEVPTLDDAGPPTNPVVAISPLIQCLDDSLRWFGQLEVSSYQVTGYDLQPAQDQRGWDLLGSVLGWFSVVVPSDVTRANVTLASTRREDDLASQVFARLEGAGASFFRFGPLLSVLDSEAAGIDWDWLKLGRTDAAIAVSMPEWSTAAAGWLIATVFEIALSLQAPPSSLSVRVSRL